MNSSLEGASYSEAADGTNGSGLRWPQDPPSRCSPSSTSTIPSPVGLLRRSVDDPVRPVVGLIDLSSLWNDRASVQPEARVQRCRTDRREPPGCPARQDARLRRRYSDPVTRGTDLLVTATATCSTVPSRRTRAHSTSPRWRRGRSGRRVESSTRRHSVGARLTASPRHHSPRQVRRPGHRVRARGRTRRARRRTGRLAAGRDPGRAQSSRSALCRRRGAGRPDLRCPTRQADPLRRGRLGRSRRLQRGCGQRRSMDRAGQGHPGVTRTVRQTGRPARIEDYALVTGMSLMSSVARACVRPSQPDCGRESFVGRMVVLTPRHEPLPDDTEVGHGLHRTRGHGDLANAESREARAVLTEEQAALRRVATLVAQGTPATPLFSAVCDEVEALAGRNASSVVRFETDGAVTVIGTHAVGHPVGARLELDPDFIVVQVHRTGRAAISTPTTRRPRTCPRSSARSGSAPGSRARSSSRASSGCDHDRLARAPAPGRHGPPARRLYGVGGDRDLQLAGAR